MPVLIVSLKTSPQVGFSRNRSNAPRLPVHDDDAERQRVRDRRQHDGRLGRPLLMLRQRRVQVEVRQHVAADDERPLIGKLLGGVPHRSGRAVIRVRARVPHGHAEVGSVPEVVHDLVGLEVQDRDQVRDAMAAQQRHDVFHHGAIADGDHRFRTIDRERLETGAEATRHDDAFHLRPRQLRGFTGDHARNVPRRTTGGNGESYRPPLTDGGFAVHSGGTCRLNIPSGC